MIKDGHIITEVEEEVAFSKSFEIGSHSCTIIQHGDKYELRLDNQVFNHLMDLERNKLYFGKNSNPTSTTIQSNIGMNDRKGMGFGISNQYNVPKEDNKAPLFSFAIKPVTNNNQPKKQIDFPQPNEHKGTREEQGSTNNNKSNNLLIDFSSDIPQDNSQGEFTNKVNSNKSMNPMDIFNSVDFNASSNVEAKQPQNDIFDMTKSTQNSNNSNNFGNQNNNNMNFNTSSNNMGGNNNNFNNNNNNNYNQMQMLMNNSLK